MDSGRSQAGQLEFREPKRKKKIPGVIPNNPFPIIFWKKLGIPPCSDLWPSYNGLYDGEGVLFPSSEDISDIHSMGHFGRRVFEEKGHESNIRGIPLVRERQWKMMVKWATDFGYVISDRDTSEDGRKENDGDDDKEAEFNYKTRSRRGINTNIEGSDSEEKGKEKESCIIGDGSGIDTCEGSLRLSEKSEHQETYDEETEERGSGGKVQEDAEKGMKECCEELKQRETDNVKGNAEEKELREESGEGQQEIFVGNKGNEKSNDHEGERHKGREEMVEVDEEICAEENHKIKKSNQEKKEDSISSSDTSEMMNQSDMVVEVKEEISLNANLHKRAVISERKTETKDTASAKESVEKGNIQSTDDFLEIIEEKSRTSEIVDENNTLQKKPLKRNLKMETCSDKEKRLRRDASKWEDNVMLSKGSHKTSDAYERKSSNEVLNSSGDCEIVEINDRNTSLTEGWGDRSQDSEMDDEIIVVNVDDGASSSSHRSRGWLFPNKSLKDVTILPLRSENQVMENDAGKNTNKKCKKMKRKEGEAIEIDDNVVLEGEEDLSRSDDVEELYQERSRLRNCDDKVADEIESTVSSAVSDCEVSPCIVIPDSDSDDGLERNPQWESDPSFFLPSLDWLKLLPEEAFFLAYGLGCVQVWDGRRSDNKIEVIQVEEKKQFEGDGPLAAVDSLFKTENSGNVASLPSDSKSSDDRLQMVPSLDDMNNIAAPDSSSILKDGKTASCDRRVNNKKENIQDNQIERNLVSANAVEGNHSLSSDKRREKKSCSINEERCSSECSDKNGLITVIDLVDSPPPHQHLLDVESFGHDNVAIDRNQMSQSMFNFRHKAMSLEELWNAFRQNRSSQSSVPFETSYAVYHHFRSKGWVVKPGIRFGGDFLLYKEGPSFYHASYLVVIDSSLPHEPSSITWSTLAGFNRLAENVAKELMICRVEWPQSMMETQLRSPKCLDGLTVEETIVKRWVSMKERDADEEVSDEDKDCDFIPLDL